MERQQRGMTLVELLIAVGIVGILAAIAYPNYRIQVMRSVRTEARTALEQRALQLEKCFTRFMTYDDRNCPAGQASANMSTAHYTITIAALSATQFTLKAAARASQVADAACTSMTLDENGQRRPAGCW